MVMVASNQISSATKFQFIRYKFASLRDNLTLIIEFLSEVQNRPEDRLQFYQIMKIKTNFFIDEIDFHLRGDVNEGELLKDFFAVYASFYHRSRTEMMRTLREILPNRHIQW